MHLSSTGTLFSNIVLVNSQSKAVCVKHTMLYIVKMVKR